MRRRSLLRWVLPGCLTLLLTPVVLLGAVAAGVTQLPADATASTHAASDIPPDLLVLYQRSAVSCPGLSWTVLAGVGKVESDHNRPPGQVSTAGAQGPMQFLPATWAAYRVDGNGDGTADPFQPADAIAAAANYLCASGAGRDTPTAVAAYFCGGLTDCRTRAKAPGGYAHRVLSWAARYADTRAPGGPAATVALQVALAQVGTPYLWGGEEPGGFDCSGLVQFAYAQAGITLPRTAQQQFNAGPRLPLVAEPQPGDLVFFGTSPDRITHMGMALGQGRMVDAPRTGAFVRVEPIAGFRNYQGATRPATYLAGLL